jgi:putative transposase
MRYRRAKVTGASYFFTVNLADRKSQLLVEQVDILRESIRHVKKAHPFDIDAMIIMPDHLHAVWTLPESNNDFSTRWNLIKGGFSRRIAFGEKTSASRSSKGERGIWQRRFWEHLIRDDNDFERHVDYIHYNPVKHGYVQRPADWPLSSIHRYIKYKILDKNWACGDDFKQENFGET